MLNKKEIEQLLKIQGNVRCDILKTDFDYIKKREGAEAFKKINSEMKKIDERFNYKHLKNIGWAPIGWKLILMNTAKKLFKWNNKDLFDMGHSQPVNSFIIKTVLKYFASLERNFKETTNYWIKYWNIGKLVPHKLDLNKKIAIVKIKNFKVHPNLCSYLTGNIKAFAELILKNKNIKVKETKCIFRGDSYHEYTIKW